MYSNMARWAQAFNSGCRNQNVSLAHIRWPFGWTLHFPAIMSYWPGKNWPELAFLHNTVFFPGIATGQFQKAETQKPRQYIYTSNMLVWVIWNNINWCKNKDVHELREFIKNTFLKNIAISYKSLWSKGFVFITYPYYTCSYNKTFGITELLL